jgi:hypothetical protein
VSPMKRTAVSLLAMAVALAAAATTPKIPGYVRIGDSLPSVYAPCAAAPNLPFANPGTDTGAFYYRYDASVLPVAGPSSYGKYQGQGGATHTDQYGGYDGMMYPIVSGLHPPIPFPAPPVSAHLCTQIVTDPKTGRQVEEPLYPGAGCPTADSATYSRVLAAHPDWLGAVAAFKKNGHYAEDCQGVAPTIVPPTAAPGAPKTATPKAAPPAAGGTCCDPPNCPAGAPLPRCTSPTAKPSSSPTARAATAVPATATRPPSTPTASAAAPTARPTSSAPLPTPTANPSCWFCGCTSK